VSEAIYTLGIWTVKPGMEQQFIDTWSEFATWSKSSFAGAMSVVLLQDRENPRRFISVGPWRSSEDIAQWRGSEGFKSRVKTLQPMLERFEPGSFTAVCRIEE
jgi:heme-degrading monooxygenase HmoA